MNQIIFRQENDAKENKKKFETTKVLKIVGIIFVSVLLITGVVLGIMVFLNMDKPIFIPEQTQLDIYIHKNNIIVEAYNSQGLESLFYKWEGSNNFSVYPQKEQSTKLNAVMPILKGRNTLYIEVIDSNGNKTAKEQKIIGVTEAKINIIVQDGYYTISVNDEEKIENIEYEFNNINYSVNAGGAKDFSFKQKLEYGKNIIKVKVLNSNGVYNTKEMEYQFN